MASIGTAFVDVRADLSKFNADVDEGAASLLGKFGGIIKDNLGKIAIVAAGVALEQIGEKFDAAFDKIRIATGTTGEALKGLEGDFKKTLSGVPSSMGDVSTAIAGISQKLGLTGKPLQDLSTQILTLSRITGTDLAGNIDSVTGLFNQWGISVGDQGKKLDELFRASQKTGVSVGALATQMAAGGTQFRAAGLNFEQTAAVVGLLGKNGLEAAAVIPGLTRALAVAAKAGKPAQQFFQDTFTAIRNAPNDTKAAEIGLAALGARVGPKFAALIREGKLSYEDFSKAIAEGGDTIVQAAKDTDDWREKLETLKNKALVALEPIASRVFEGLTNLIGFAADAIDRFSKSPAWTLIRDTILPGIGHAFQDFLFTFQNPDTAINATGWEGVVFRIGAAFGKAFQAIKDVVGDAVDFVVRNWPTIQAVVRTVMDAVSRAVSWVADHVLPALVNAEQAVVDFVEQRWPQIKAIAEDVFSAIGRAVGAVVDYIAANWPQVQAAFQATVDWLQNADWGGLFDRIKQGYQASADWITSVGVPDLGAAWQWLQDQAQALAAYVSERWTDIQKAVDNVITYLKVLFVEFFGPVIALWQTSHDQILAIVVVVWNQMKAIIELAINSIKAIIDIVLGILSLDWSRTWQGIQDLLGGSWNFMVATVGNGIEAIKQIVLGGLLFIQGVFNLAWEIIKGLVGSAWDNIAREVGVGIDAIEALIRSLPGRAASALGGFFGAVFGPLVAPFLAAAGIIVGNLQRILDMIERVKSAATLGSLGNAGIAADIASGKKTATGGLFDRGAEARIIGEAGTEAVINGDQAVRLLWAMANGGTPAGTVGQQSTTNYNVNVVGERVVADADDIGYVLRGMELLAGGRR